MAEPQNPGGARPDLRAQLIDQIGGWRGVFDSGLPIVVFVVANAVGGLLAGIVAAVAAAVVLLGVRLARRERVQQAFSGLFGVAVAAFIAWRTGQARGFFLLGIWRNLAYGVLFLGSVLVRWPIIGFAWEYLEGKGTAWRSDRRLRRTYTAVTLVWALVFFSRAFVQHFFYVRNATGWLAATSLAMGYPLFAVAVGITILAVRRVRRTSSPEPAVAAQD